MIVNKALDGSYGSSGLAELAAGILFIAGFFLPLGAVLITLVMIGAIAKVHGANGFANAAGGFEYNVVLIVIAIGLALNGPGAYSIKEFLGM